MSVVVIEFTTVDGIVSDPDGSGDRFGLGRTLDEGVVLLGRSTWEAFARLWPGRDEPFPARLNAVPKLVVSRTLSDVSAWANSRVVEGDLLDAVKTEQRDVIVMGSIGVVHALAAADLVDEYRLLTFPTVLGAGRPLFPAGGPPAELECVSAERSGALVLTRYRRARG
ncbi:dihydrofolate reductase family protein [Streptomyces sp. NPDC048179]|uniref:dihydrofolate reductase family protein n=1 Tax=Streptomyces sp. NPDC048179 TaxID=3365506 RepID=UPI0037210888